jgi:DeoR family fructose operon transcriptional repressor
MKEIRRSKIAEIIRKKGSIKINDLADMFKISPVTIYRDLDFLEKQGVLRRLRGGAITNLSSEEVHYPFRASSCISEKMQIAEEVVKLISEGDTIILDGSTTNIYVAKKIKEINNLTIFTTSPLVTLELLNSPNIILYCIGGLYSREIAQFVGSNIEDFISNLHVTKSIIGASAVCSEFGITGPYPQFVSIQKKIISASSKVILAADHTKFGKVSLEKIADIDAIDFIVVDSGIDKKYVEELQDKTNIIVAKN